MLLLDKTAALSWQRLLEQVNVSTTAASSPSAAARRKQLKQALQTTTLTDPMDVRQEGGVDVVHLVVSSPRVGPLECYMGSSSVNQPQPQWSIHGPILSEKTPEVRRPETGEVSECVCM